MDDSLLNALRARLATLAAEGQARVQLWRVDGLEAHCLGEGRPCAELADTWSARLRAEAPSRTAHGYYRVVPVGEGGLPSDALLVAPTSRPERSAEPLASDARARAIQSAYQAGLRLGQRARARGKGP